MAAGTEKRTRRAATPPGWVGWLILAIVAIALVTSAMLILLAPAFVPSDLTHGANLRAEAESSIRTTMLQAIGGLVVLVGLCLTARTVYLSRETHVTDRLSRAVDQLGDEKPEVRIGGVYALKRLAEKSPIDRELILGVLKGFLECRAISPAESIGPDLQCALDIYLQLRGP